MTRVGKSEKIGDEKMEDEVKEGIVWLQGCLGLLG